MMRIWTIYWENNNRNKINNKNKNTPDFTL